ncbi:hypothetical protein LOD99_2896 [Oopsacas minuta]|uniref:Uncharacterized protein n=1 Tax=Oopsacas minuta TaxID=111878 RepID=A0AAV7K0D5_9METZ|nr:hypothetical protein LOD99_2896 [Oopsacas minuta]
MPDSFIFMCVRSDMSVVVQERFASDNALPPEVDDPDLTLVNFANDASIINCTFTSPVLGNPDLNNPGGYYVLLAWGGVSGGLTLQHLGPRHGRCVSSTRIIITIATGGPSSASMLCLSLSTFVLMLTLLFLV